MKLRPPVACVAATTFTFDLQRFAFTGTESNAAFSCVINGETKYGLASEFTTANVGTATEITLLDNITLSTGVTLSAPTCNVDFGGKTVTYTGANGRVEAFKIASNANVTMTNGNINYTSNWAGEVAYAVNVSSSGTLNLGNTTADDNKTFGITVSNNYPVCVFIDGGTLNVNNDATLRTCVHKRLSKVWI